MSVIEATHADVTRNERGEVVLSLAVPSATGISGESATLFLRETEGMRRAAVRDLRSGTMLSLPLLSETAFVWISSVRPWEGPTSDEEAIPSDPRNPGQPYVLVCEVVGSVLVAGYAARVRLADA